MVHTVNNTKKATSKKRLTETQILEKQVLETQVLIVGAGPSGLSCLIKLKEAGVQGVQLVDKSTRIGGTWANNDYPGLSCDIPSEMYSLGYAPNPDWSRTYAPQAEIQQYLEKTAHDFAVVNDIRLETEVLDARWDEAKQQWRVTTQTLESQSDANNTQSAQTDQVVQKTTYLTRFFVVATGFIGEPEMPPIVGKERFKGKLFHSAEWDYAHDLTNKSVAVIGSGASAVQFLPVIQPKVQTLYSFQRTPSWVLPKPDVAVPEALKAFYSRFPRLHKQVRKTALLAAEPILPLFKREKATRMLSHPLGLWNIYRSIKNQQLRKQLTPKHTLGCKRPLFSNNWYSALAQPNVNVVCHGVDAIDETGVVANGTHYAVDTIIFGTGYAVEDPVIYQRITGSQNQSLKECWQQQGPRAYQGMSIHGFPNMFMMLGPNSHSLVSSVMWTSEHQGMYIANAIQALTQQGHTRCEVKASVQREFNAALDKTLAQLPIRADVCKSYYLDSQGRNRFVWPDYGITIGKRLASVNWEDYEVSRLGS